MRNTHRVFRSDSARAGATARPEQNSLKKSQSTVSATETSPIPVPRFPRYETSLASVSEKSPRANQVERFCQWLAAK